MAEVLDMVAVSVGVCVVMYLLMTIGGLIAVRKRPYMASRGAMYMVGMCAAGCTHIISGLVAHRHFGVLENVEQWSCAVWGYWIPYVSVGAWFTCQYLQVLSYTTVLSERVSHDRLKCFVLWRPFIAVLTMLPPIIISTTVTVFPGVSGVDPTTGTCHSIIWAKGAVAAWITGCIIILATSLVRYRTSMQDPLGEIPRQWVVLLVSLVAVFGQAFVIVFATTGLDYAPNRFAATVSLAAMYATTMCVLTHRPLWKAFRGDSRYAHLQTRQLARHQRSSTSIMDILNNPLIPVTPAVRVIFADFLVYCSEDSRHHPVAETRFLVAAYNAADFWTRQRLSAIDAAYDPSAKPYGRVINDDFPPLCATGTTRCAVDICREFGTLMSSCIDKAERGGIGDTAPADTFRAVLWHIIELLDDTCGEQYLLHDSVGRNVYTSASHADVRETFVRIVQVNSNRRMHDIGVELVIRDAEDAIDLQDSDSDE